MKEKHYRITDVAALLVSAVFALCLLLVLLTGAEVYRGLVQSGEASYLRRTTLQYLTTRVRQAESVRIGSFEGCETLILEESAGEDACTTRVYCYDGWLRELYCVPGAQVSPQDGAALLEAADFSLNREGDLLILTVGADTLYLWLPAETEAGA